MKVLIDCHLPFSLAHGGMQVQIEETMRALNAIGVAVEPLRWWDKNQEGDILHHFGRLPTSLVRYARDKGMRVVILDLLTGQGSRTKSRLRLQRGAMCLLRTIFPEALTNPFNWTSYSEADACIVNTPWEKEVLALLFAADPAKIHVLPNGVEEVFLKSAPVQRKSWLVCTATITERKRVLELAKAAVLAGTPLWVVGRPYSETDTYAQSFADWARKHSSLVRYEGAITNRAQLADLYRSARGFVLLSTMETRSLSAEEAAACECPLLLSDLPWARSVFGEDATYYPVTASIKQTAEHLRRFYDTAPSLRPPAKPLTWIEVAQQLKKIYERLLSTSR